MGSADECVPEDVPEGVEMIQEQQVIRELGVRREDPAYTNGWEDGRFGPTRPFLDNPSLVGWADHVERLAYYRGHRDGLRVRGMLASEHRA